MKKVKFILGALIIGSSLIACQNNTEKNENTAEPKTQKKQAKKETAVVKDIDWDKLDIDPILKDYLIIKDEFVKENVNGVGKNTEKLITDLNNFDFDRVADKHQDFAKSIVQDAKEVATQMESAENIEKKRKHFYHLSEIMTKYVMTVGSKEPIYEQYCPMYNDDRGGAWLSLNKEIRNPYFGSKMLKCGELRNEF